MRTFVEIIAAKRDGQTLSPGEITSLVEGLGRGELADYQMAALLMAVFFRGLDDAETVALTQAMLAFGRVLDLGGVAGVKVDKHSTGGVGDKVSICLAPLVAACGVPVPMVSGRGLGHTGGTLDKLEAIPGFRTELLDADFARIVRRGGPLHDRADRTRSRPPTSASTRCATSRRRSSRSRSSWRRILSKKLAEGIDALVLDVKVGRGAFMKDRGGRARAGRGSRARGHARRKERRRAAHRHGMRRSARAVGNAIETREALEVLHGGGPADLVECTLLLGAEMLVLGGVAQGWTRPGRGFPRPSPRARRRRRPRR